MRFAIILGAILAGVIGGYYWFYEKVSKNSATVSYETTVNFLAANLSGFNVNTGETRTYKNYVDYWFGEIEHCVFEYKVFGTHYSRVDDSPNRASLSIYQVPFESLDLSRVTRNWIDGGIRVTSEYIADTDVILRRGHIDEPADASVDARSTFDLIVLSGEYGTDHLDFTIPPRSEATRGELLGALTNLIRLCGGRSASF